MHNLYTLFSINRVIQTMSIRPSCRSAEGRLHKATLGEDFSETICADMCKLHIHINYKYSYCNLSTNTGRLGLW